jgi:uncharacterized membrane protein (Fun14 family)
VLTTACTCDAPRAVQTALEEIQANPQAVLGDLVVDLGPGLSFGTVCGFASGFTLKKAGKVAIVVRLPAEPPWLSHSISVALSLWLCLFFNPLLALLQLVGGIFMGLQGLASQGVITINWHKLVELFGTVRACVETDGHLPRHGFCRASLSTFAAHALPSIPGVCVCRHST